MKGLSARLALNHVEDNIAPWGMSGSVVVNNHHHYEIIRA